MKISKENLQIITEAKRYFNAKVIGSYILVEKELISEEFVNDIDLMVSPENSQLLTNFLEDMGFSQTIEKGSQIGYNNGYVIYKEIPKGDFRKEGFSIDVTVGTDGVYSINELLAKKIERGLKKDYEQLLIIFANKLNLDLKALLHHRDSSVGLYCIDKDPNDPKYKFDKDLFFQLEFKDSKLKS